MPSDCNDAPFPNVRFLRITLLFFRTMDPFLQQMHIHMTNTTSYANDDMLCKLWLCANVLNANASLHREVEDVLRENSALRSELRTYVLHRRSFDTVESETDSTDHTDSANSADEQRNDECRIRRGVWSHDEHDRFLDGLRQHGPSKWKIIAREYVRTRTPSQVASHAQKYFIRMKKIAPPTSGYDRS